MEKKRKVIEAELLATTLKVTFDNNEIRYVSTRLTEDLINNTQKMMKKMFIPPTFPTVGNKVEINSVGDVIINQKEVYLSEELWVNGKKISIKLIYQVTLKDKGKVFKISKG